MSGNSADHKQDGQQGQEGDLEGMAVEVSSNQVRDEAIPASHHEEKGQESVVQNEKHSHRSARHEQGDTSRDGSSRD
jgi:hypothetical protein